MLVPPHVLQCSVFVGASSGSGAIQPKGTGFLVGRAVNGTNEQAFAVYCVTARHVIDRLITDGRAQVWLRLNRKQGADWLPTNIGDWLFHPNGKVVDVAVFPFDLDLPAFNLDQHDNRACPLSIAADHGKIAAEEIGVGEEVFAVGLFDQHFGTKRNIPIVRVGHIAAMPEELVDAKVGPIEAYLTEMKSIGGHSGSPVFVNLGTTRIVRGRHKIAETTNPKILLLGLMHGHWDLEAHSIDSVGEDGISKNEKINTGIAMVVPVGKIIETLDQDKIKEHEKKIGDAFRYRNSPTMDDWLRTSSVRTTDPI